MLKLNAKVSENHVLAQMLYYVFVLQQKFALSCIMKCPRQEQLFTWDDLGMHGCDVWDAKLFWIQGQDNTSGPGGCDQALGQLTGKMSFVNRLSQLVPWGNNAGTGHQKCAFKIILVKNQII